LDFVLDFAAFELGGSALAFCCMLVMHLGLVMMLTIMFDGVSNFTTDRSRVDSLTASVV